ncbi:MAG: S26 family signal peptidase [Halobacteria archaeon]|nr:S26 family signal peptidase [Halobacteria archaeon]
MEDGDGLLRDRIEKIKRNSTIKRINEFRNRPGVKFVEDILSSILIVGLIALILWGIAGVWPPMVAVESGSMEPHMHRGDLVFVVDNNRFVPDNAETNHGIVTYQQGKEIGYKTFGNYGDVIIFRPNGNSNQPPVIHRAMKYVEKGEEWKGVSGTHTAPHSGFVTKGDNNKWYDQESGISKVVKPEWVVGKAKVSIPYLGRIRLFFDSLTTIGYYEYRSVDFYVYIDYDRYWETR